MDADSVNGTRTAANEAALRGHVLNALPIGTRQSRSTLWALSRVKFAKSGGLGRGFCCPARQWSSQGQHGAFDPNRQHGHQLCNLYRPLGGVVRCSQQEIGHGGGGAAGF